MKKLNIEYVRDIIEKTHPGAVLLSTEYINCNKKIDIVCENRHNFSHTWKNLQKGSWCSKCSGYAKKTIPEIKQFINDNHPGAFLISKDYKNGKQKLDIICENNHQFKMAWTAISCKRLSWCPKCAGNNKKTILEVKEFIDINHSGSKLISKEYINSNSKLEMICEKGHEFKSRWDNIKGFHWCPVCSGHVIKPISEIKAFIVKNHFGSQLISKEYKNSDTKLDIICENGHLFRTMWGSVKFGKWCPKCAGNNKKTILEVKEFIDNNHPGSKLISKEYINSSFKLEIICENGHIYNTTWSSIQSGNWCAVCVGLAKKTIPEIKTFIDKKHPGAILLSKDYINSHQKLDIVCEKGHKFETTWGRINQNFWCTYCNNRIGEKTCRKVFEKKFAKSFFKIRPQWLKNPKTNCLLELDGFNKELNIAFEYDGEQHYVFPNCFHKTREQFDKQVERDLLKDNLCKQNNIKLIRIKSVNCSNLKKAELLILEQIESIFSNDI